MLMFCRIQRPHPTMMWHLAISLFAFCALQITAAPTSCQSSNGATLRFHLGECIIRSPTQSDVYSWGFNLNIADAGELCLVPSTVTNATFFTADGICSSPDQLQANGVAMTEDTCRSRRGSLLPTQNLKAAPTEDLRSNPGWTALGNPMDRAVEVSLKLLRRTVKTTAGLIYQGQQSTASHFGLASDSTILRTLKDVGIIGARSFGLNVGSQSFLFPRSGSLVLGGWDTSSVTSSSFLEFPINPDGKLQDRYCPLQVQITDLTLQVKKINETTWTNSNTIAGPGNPLTACVEPYDNLFRLPSTMIAPVKDFINRTGFVSTGRSTFLKATDYADSLVNLEPGLVYHSDAGQFNTTLRFTLQPKGSKDSLTIEIPQYEFQRPLKGLDQDGAVKVDTNYTELQIYGEPAAGDAAVLGKVFLSQVYLFVDYEAGKFYMAPQNTEATSPLPLSSTCPAKLSSVEKGLFALVAVVGFSLLAVVVKILHDKIRERNRDRGQRPADSVGEQPEMVANLGDVVADPAHTDNESDFQNLQQVTGGVHDGNSGSDPSGTTLQNGHQIGEETMSVASGKPQPQISYHDVSRIH